MKVELQTFFKATNPSRTLVVDNPEDQKFYIDFSPVRGQIDPTVSRTTENLAHGSGTVKRSASSA